jgi:phage replication O-like protein O
MGYDPPNYTKTPNLFLDEHLSEMGCAETKVVLAVIRKTFGWHKGRDRLSISQLMEITGLSNRAVIDGTQQAIERGVIDRQKNGNSYEYWLVVDGEDTSQGGDQGVNNAHTPCEDTSQEGVNEPHTQKKGKETKQKKESAPAHEDPVDALKDLWDVHPTTYQKDRIRQVVDDEDTWEDVLDELKMQNKDSKKAIGWAVSDYQDRPTGDGAPASKYYPSDDPDL